MSLNFSKNCFLNALKEFSFDDALDQLSSCKADLATHEIRKKLKDEFAHISELANLASSITISNFERMYLDYRIMEDCQFSLNYESQEVCFTWQNYYEAGGDGTKDYYSLHYNFSQNEYGWELLQEFDTPEDIEINIGHWKKVARKLGTMEIKAFEFVKFIGFICSLGESILILDEYEEIPWNGPEGEKSWSAINPFEHSSDSMPDNIYFILPIAEEVKVCDDDLITLEVKHHDDYAINAINAALKNETDIFVLQQSGSGEPEVDKQGFIASIVKEVKQKNGSYTVQLKRKYRANIKEVFRSSSCFAAKISKNS